MTRRSSTPRPYADALAAPAVPVAPPARAPADVAVTLSVHAHADGREIVVRRTCRADAADGLPRVRIDAVVR